MAQLELVLTRERRGREQAKVDAVKLTRHLYARAAWIKANHLAAEFGWSPRYIRMLKSLTDGEVISGNNGYKHASSATEDEWQEYWRKEQASIKERSEQLQKSYRYYHKVHGRK